MYGYKLGQGSVLLRLKILDSASLVGAGKTGLTSATSGLSIGTIADNEATSTGYTVAGSTIESIGTLGTFAAPTATKCRFKEVDATLHPGLYELQIADARFAVASAKGLIVSIKGTGIVETDQHIALTDFDPYSVLANLFTRALTESYAADGAAPTVAQALLLIQQSLNEWVVSGTNVSIKKLDGSTQAAALTLNSATAPTSMSRSA